MASGGHNGTKLLAYICAAFHACVCFFVPWPDTWLKGGAKYYVKIDSFVTRVTGRAQVPLPPPASTSSPPIAPTAPPIHNPPLQEVAIPSMLEHKQMSMVLTTQQLQEELPRPDLHAAYKKRDSV